MQGTVFPGDAPGGNASKGSGKEGLSDDCLPFPPPPSTTSSPPLPRRGGGGGREESLEGELTVDTSACIYADGQTSLFVLSVCTTTTSTTVTTATDVHTRLIHNTAAEGFCC